MSRPGDLELAQESATDTVLAVFDRAFLTAIPLLLVGILIGFPHPRLLATWSAITAIALVVVGATVVLARRSGGARWRGAGFTAVILVTACGALWGIGPFTGVGAMYGLGVLFAGAFLPRGWLIVAVVGAVGSIVARAIVRGGGALGVVDGHYPIALPLWIATALVCGVLAWLALRVLLVMIASLERSYRSVEQAYQLETQTREQLDRSRADLEELAQVEMVGRLAGGVAHDVNNALAAVLAASDALTTEVATPDQRRHLAELEAACHHAADLVRDLLWTGRRFPASTTETADAADVARRCLERVRRVARAITVELHVPSLELAVAAEHLEQILFGLIVGADRMGVAHLAVTAQVVDATVVIVIAGAARDTSPTGEPRQMQAKLSVSAARDLIAQYGGTLELHADAHEVCARIALPAAQRADAQPAVAPAPMRTALIVEDEPMVLRRLCQLVARRGYEVTSAQTVAEGLALLAANPDLLITDLQLPDGSGEQIALASFAGHPDRRIIVCSGFSAEDITRGPLRDAPLTFLAKPFSTADFDAALAAIAVPASAGAKGPP